MSTTIPVLGGVGHRCERVCECSDPADQDDRSLWPRGARSHHLGDRRSGRIGGIPRSSIRAAEDYHWFADNRTSVPLQ